MNQIIHGKEFTSEEILKNKSISKGISNLSKILNKIDDYKKLNKENAIILCGHGSRDSDYKNEMLRFEDKIRRNIQNDVFNCFIEINEPSIEDCLDEIIHK